MNAAAVAQFEVEPRRAGLAARKGRALVCPSTKMAFVCPLWRAFVCPFTTATARRVTAHHESIAHAGECHAPAALHIDNGNDNVSIGPIPASGRPKNLNGWCSCLEVPVLPVQHPALRTKTNWSPENLRDSLPSSAQQCWVMADCVQQLASKQVAVAACTRNLK